MTSSALLNTSSSVSPTVLEIETNPLAELPEIKLNLRELKEMREFAVQHSCVIRCWAKLQP